MNKLKLRKRWLRNQLNYARRHPDKVRAIKRRCPPSSEAYRRKSANARANNLEKVHAWAAVGRAVHKGLLIRPVHCERCDRECKPQAHHPDYSKKLEVIWLCRPCHLTDTGRKIWVKMPGDPEGFYADGEVKHD